MQKELRFRLSFGRLHARRRESEKANVVINIAIKFDRLIAHKTWEIQLQMDFAFSFEMWQSLCVRESENTKDNARFAIAFGLCHNLCAHM